MTRPPIVPTVLYNQSLSGVYGEFGSGNNLKAFYLQTAISPSYLDKISLVSDVPGSEKWQVRDLFQREVDDERVTNSLLPYLQLDDKIKFFNPLTLTVLPMDERGTVLKQMPRVVERPLEEDGQKWRVLERDRFFRLRWITEHPEYARLEWSDERSRIVAIDGQHRLSALKRLQRLWLNVEEAKDGALDGVLDERPGSKYRSLLDWRIPVVVVSFRAVEGAKEPPSVLDVVRSLFVYINTEARQVGEARRVLLNDESVNAIAAQELLELAHENDLKERTARREESVPLLFFDWRGKERDGKPVPMAAAVKSIGEIRSWFEYYVLGEDFSRDQEAALGVGGGSRLKEAFRDRTLSYDRSRIVRERVREEILPAVSYVLENFEPYRRYIAGLRSLEAKYESGNDLQHHAFDRLRFGSGHGLDANKFQVDEVEKALLIEIEKLRTECLRPAVPIDQDIGMRGVMQAFGELSFQFDYPDWMEYSEWFTAGLNSVYEDGWFEAEHRGKAYKHLRHVVLNQNDSVVNYRLQDALNAFGPYLSLLVGSCLEPPTRWGADWASVENNLLSCLGSTIVRGYRKEVRPGLRDRHPNGGRELTEAVNAEAERLSGRQMRRFEQALKRLAAPAGAAAGGA